jgi:heme/copper-type cytochrome/quinol oxidase subunit 4
LVSKKVFILYLLLSLKERR